MLKDLEAVPNNINIVFRYWTNLSWAANPGYFYLPLVATRLV